MGYDFIKAVEEVIENCRAFGSGRVQRYEYGYWVTFWKPKDDIPYWIADENIGDVFTICFNDEAVDKKEAVRRAAQFMMEYAEKI